MSKTYFGFALADSMFGTNDISISRVRLDIEEVKKEIEVGVEPYLNPSHAATITAIRSLFGINLPIPQTPPRIELSSGDSLIVMGVRGLPRLTNRHEYTNDEIKQAEFIFSKYTVTP